MLVLFWVYFRFLRTSAATITATMITTATPAMSNVSVEIPVPGVGATVGEAEMVTVGVDIGVDVVCGKVGVGTVVGTVNAGPTTKYAVS